MLVMPVLRRLVRHWRLSKKQGRTLFPASTLRHFHSLIEEGAPRHRAHLKLAIEVALPTRAILCRTHARTRACAILAQHRAVDNLENSHVLIYINLADRRVEIVADAAVAQLLPMEQWRVLCDTITKGFFEGDPNTGVERALRELNSLLQQVMPAENHTAYHDAS